MTKQGGMRPKGAERLCFGCAPPCHHGKIFSPSPPNKNRNSDTKELRFLFFYGIIVPDNVIGDEKTCLTLRTKNQKFVS